MAKAKTHHSTALTHTRSSHRGGPMTITVRAPQHKKGKSKGSKGRRGGGQKAMIASAVGGAIYGFVEKSVGDKIPTVPLLGKAGTIALGGYMLGKGKPGWLTDVALAAAVLAGYQLGHDGKIAGDDDGRPAAPKVQGRL